MQANIAYVEGGGAHLSSNLGGAFASLEDTTCDGNRAPSSGGLSVNLGSTGAVAVHRGVFKRNVATGYGGGVSVTYELPRGDGLPTPLAIPLEIVNGTFADNVVAPVSSVESGHGGGFFVYPSVLPRQTASSVDLSAATSASAIADGAYAVHVRGSTFEGNTASSGAGGGVAVINEGNVKMTGCTVRNCSATQGGGFAALDSAHLRLSQTHVTGCSAATHGGGGIADANSIVTLDDAELSNCTAGVHGAGVSVEREAVLGMVGTKVTGCGATTNAVTAAGASRIVGGGAYCGGQGLYLGQGTNIAENDAGAGGGVAVNAGLFVVNGAEIASNTAIVGGGVELSGTGRAHVTNAKIAKNNAMKYGGGAAFNAPHYDARYTTAPLVFAVETLATVKGHPTGISASMNNSADDMVNVTLSENVAKDMGGGGVFWSHPMRLGRRVRCAGCVFADNKAAYGPDYATMLVAWDIRPLDQTAAALGYARARSSGEVVNNGGTIDASRMQAALKSQSKNFTVAPGEVLPAFDVLVVDAEGQRVSLPSPQLEVKLSATGATLIEGTTNKVSFP